VFQKSVMPERVSKQYWDSSWQAEARLPEAFDPTVSGLRGLFRRQFHAFFVEHLRDIAPPGSSLIEVGCGRSQLLPYFSSRFGLRVSGLDYSEIGCEKARRILQRERISGEIFCGDLWTFDAFPAPGFDVVFSFGLVEHFEDTAGVIRGLARFVRPGGAVLTLIPNMLGSVGALQRALSREIYDIHVPLSAAVLARAHAEAGLSVQTSGYLLPAHFGVCNPGTRFHHGVSARARDLAYRAAIAASTVLLWVHERVVPLPVNERMSPYAFAVATKPQHVPAASATAHEARSAS
jgi:SAM-dependent methyltransferase